MKIIKYLPFYILLFYQLIGFLTYSFLDISPFYLLSFMFLVSFISLLFSQRKIVIPSYAYYYLVYILLIAFSKYYIHNLPLRLDTQFYLVLYPFVTFIAFIIIENTGFDHDFKRNSIQIMKYLIYIAFTVSIIQYFSYSFFVNPNYAYKYDIVGYARRIPSIYTWGGFNWSKGISICLIAMYGILVYEFKNNRRLTFLIVVLTAGVVFLSQMRAAMLTFTISSILLVFNKLSLRNTVLITGFLIFSYFVIDFLDFNVHYFVEERLKSESANTRITAFYTFFESFPDNPYFGTGGVLNENLFNAYGFEAQLHNAHLAIAYYYGIFTFIFHTLFIIVLSVKTYKTGNLIGYWPPFTAMMVYILATMTMPSGDFLLPGLLIVLIMNKYVNERKFII